MLCSNCTKKVYDNLKPEELAVLYYVYGREAKLDAALKEGNNHDVKKLVRLINDAKTISVASGLKLHRVSEILSFFSRLSIVRKVKADHTLNYEIDTLGKSMIAMLESDQIKFPAVQALLKEASRRA